MPKNVLVADDSLTIRKVIGMIFATEDVQLTAVDNGIEAISKARELRPDLVLADVVMPGKNGYEVCEALKGDPNTQGIPVLLLAGTFEAFDENRARSVRADAHIMKPFESQALLEKYRALTGAALGARPPAAAPNAMRPMPAAPATPRPSAPMPMPPGQRPAPPPSAPGALRPPGPGMIPQGGIAPMPGIARPGMMPGPARPGMMPGPARPGMMPAAPMGRPNPMGAMPPPAAPRPGMQGPVPGARPGMMPMGRPPGPGMPNSMMGVPAPMPAQIPRPGMMPPPGGMPGPGQRRDPFGLGVAQPQARTDGAFRPSQPQPGPDGMSLDLGDPGGAATRPPTRPSAPRATDEVALLREALSKVSREMIEKIAWEVVPQLAETIIREELDRLIKERETKH